MTEPGQTVAVWDGPVRAFHWSLVGFFGLAYWLENDWPSLHSHAGYTVALLVAFRIAWGFIGSRHARFDDFVQSPSVTMRYLNALVRGRAPRHMGHDPAGAAMILLLLASLAVTSLSGMCLFAMEGSGPFAGTVVADWPGGIVVDVHHFFSDFTLAMIGAHVAGVVLTSAMHRENLIKAMLTGRKSSGSDDGK